MLARRSAADPMDFDIPFFGVVEGIKRREEYIGEEKEHRAKLPQEIPRSITLQRLTSFTTIPLLKPNKRQYATKLTPILWIHHYFN